MEMDGEAADSHPGEPWEHYIVKNREHGFKCLKCGKVGYVTNIREQGRLSLLRLLLHLHL